MNAIIGLTQGVLEPVVVLPGLTKFQNPKYCGRPFSFSFFVQKFMGK